MRARGTAVDRQWAEAGRDADQIAGAEDRARRADRPDQRVVAVERETGRQHPDAEIEAGVVRQDRRSQGERRPCRRVDERRIGQADGHQNPAGTTGRRDIAGHRGIDQVEREIAGRIDGARRRDRRVARDRGVDDFEHRPVAGSLQIDGAVIDVHSSGSGRLVDG